MTHVWLYAGSSVVSVSLLSLIGVVVLSKDPTKQVIWIPVAVSLAVGAMFGDAFIHLVPDAFARSRNAASLYVLVGIFGLFVLERLLSWRAEHHVGAIRPVGYMNLVADGVHNFLDGALIGASYLAGLHVGLATTLAVVLHEIPHEIGDFGVLLFAGFSRRSAILLNLLSASLAIFGMVAVLLAGARFHGVAEAMLPVTAGGFIYMAGSDLMPELLKTRRSFFAGLELAAMAAGVGVMALFAFLD